MSAVSCIPVYVMNIETARFALRVWAPLIGHAEWRNSTLQHQYVLISGPAGKRTIKASIVGRVFWSMVEPVAKRIYNVLEDLHALWGICLFGQDTV